LRNLIEGDAHRPVFTVQMADQHLGNVGGQGAFLFIGQFAGKTFNINMWHSRLLIVRSIN
jgi:hypothetical protein